MKKPDFGRVEALGKRGGREPEVGFEPTT
jgi:hypothetical protein